jgi:2-polyprenyl-3-methyl-5-hydroxy-6-metoxy-1,4-benzoquinol methylase
MIGPELHPNATNDENAFIRAAVARYRASEPGDRHVDHIANNPGVAIYEASANQVKRSLPRGSKVLDWGCGYGHLSFLVAQRGYEVHGWESFPSPPIPEFFAKASYRQIAPGEPLPTGEKFDAILSSGTLEHVVDLHASITEVMRLLRPGGLFFVFRFPAEYSVSEYVARRAGRWSHAVRLRRRELEVLLQTHGVRILESGYETFLPVALAGRSRRLQSLRSRFGHAIDLADLVLTRTPVVRAFSTSMFCIGQKNDEYEETTLQRRAVRER